jgi:glutathione S-transferase
MSDARDAPSNRESDATDSSDRPFRVYGSQVSYYTGKLESYLRYKEIPYEFVSTLPGQLSRRTGAGQVPALELPDGRFITDSTPIIRWLESEYPEAPVVPSDPMQAFVAWLIEDYADEWLWRPAMHYRWSYDLDKYTLSRKLADELMPDHPAPSFIKRFMIRRRQRGIFVTGDGVDAATRSHVERGYLCALDLLSSILERQPFVLGAHPTIADFGLMGPMFRHFSHDPTPAAIMQKRAPLVWEWVARMWSARGSRLAGGVLVDGIPSEVEALIKEAGETHLVYLAENAIAWHRGEQRFDVTVQGTRYRAVPTSRYRVWCLEQLRKRFAALPEPASGAARELLEKNACWDALWRPEEIASGYDPDDRAPFGEGLEVLTARGARAFNA